MMQSLRASLENPRPIERASLLKSSSRSLADTDSINRGFEQLPNQLAAPPEFAHNRFPIERGERDLLQTFLPTCVCFIR
jgi:hypothetical protein